MSRAVALLLVLFGCSGESGVGSRESRSESASESVRDSLSPESGLAQSHGATEGEDSASESASASASESVSGSPADALARELWRAAGGESLAEVAQLDFRFVVTDAGETVFEAAHRWDREGGRDRVSWTDREGALHDAVVSLADRSACGHVDGTPVTGDDRDALAEAAYGRWVNDAYWLMVPLKVLDPGVERALLEPAEGRRRLQLTFDSVGLTPGDRYVLFIDEENRLTRWEMDLEGAEPDAPMSGVSFENHTAVGPLTLPLDHATDEGDRQILLRDVAAHGSVRTDAFAVRGCE